jgi:hypothetical protein
VIRVSKALERFLATINDVPVPPERLLALLNQHAELGRGSSGFGSLSITKLSVHVPADFPRPTLEAAAMYRLIALLRLLGRNESLGWCLPAPSAEGPAWSEHPIFAVAATEPIVA